MEDTEDDLYILILVIADVAQTSVNIRICRYMLQKIVRQCCLCTLSHSPYSVIYLPCRMMLSISDLTDSDTFPLIVFSSFFF